MSPAAPSLRRIGTALWIVATLLLALALVVAGVVTVGFAAGFVGVPSVTAVDGEFGAVTDSHTEVRTHLVVDNPNPVGAEPADLSAAYTVELNDVEVAAEDGERLAMEPGRSSETLTTRIRHDRLPAWWASHVNAGERTDVVVEGRVSSDVLDRGIPVEETRTVETDLLSSFESEESRPIDVDVPVVGTQRLYVDATRAAWGSVDERRTELELGFDVYNPGFTVTVTDVRYRLTVNGLVLAEGAIEDEYVLESGTETAIDGTATVDTDRIVAWWISHLENDETSTVRLEFEAEAELPDGSTIDVPLEELAHEETIETDLLGDGGVHDDVGETGTAGAGTDGDRSSQSPSTAG